MEAPGAASRIYQNSVLPNLPSSFIRAYVSSGWTCTESLAFASRNFASKGKRQPKRSITLAPSNLDPCSCTSDPSVLPLYGSFSAIVVTSVSHDSPIATSPGGSCFHPSRSSRRPPQIVSCNEDFSLMGCNISKNLSYQ